MSTNVMLADFLYNMDRGPSYYVVPLNIGYVASYARDIHGDKFDFRLYRNVDDFIKDFNKKPPQIIGFSQYKWNEYLSFNMLKWIKKVHPEVISVFGGPMVGSNEVDIEVFMKKNPLVDFCVPFYGEYGFSMILDRYSKCEGNLKKMKSEPIEGVAFFANDSKDEIIYSATSQYNIKPEDIPSPYLSGSMDSFLEEGYSPMIQSMRGCPYTCTYCYASNLKVMKYPLERVFKELDYIYQRSSSPALTLTDDNFGIFERDVEIAERIRFNYDKNGYPSKCYLFHAKKYNKTVINILKIMKDLTPVYVSHQSHNTNTLKAVKRLNIKSDDVLSLVSMAKENNAQTICEMIFGLPYETKDSFIEGLQTAYTSNIDTVVVYNYRILPGTELARKDSMEKYKIRTKHRLYEDNFGIFNTHDSYEGFTSCETDEISVATSSFSFEDFIEVRKFGFLVELCFSNKIYYEILKHLETYGMAAADFIAAISNKKFNMPQKVESFFHYIQKNHIEELFDTYDDLNEFIESQLSKNEKFKTKKINFYYIYLLLYTDMRDNFSFFIRKALMQMANENLHEDKMEEFLAPLEELFDYHDQKIVDIDLVNEKPMSKYSYDFIKWEKELYSRPLKHYKLAEGDKVGIRFIVNIPEQFKTFIENNTEESGRPLTWHNYLYSGAFKSHCEYS